MTNRQDGVYGLVGIGLMLVLAGAPGCASYRINSTAQSVKGQGDQQEIVHFQIAAASFVAPTNVASGGTPDFGVLQIDSNTLRDKMAAAARKQYPKVFTDDADAIPLQVTVTRKGYENFIGADSCVSCLSLTIYPLRTSDRTDYRVEVAAVAPRTVPGLKTVDFSREETGWLSFFPTGWIPVPGGRGDRVWGTDNSFTKTQEIMLESCVKAVVTILQQSGPSVWKTGTPAP